MVKSGLQFRMSNRPRGDGRAVDHGQPVSRDLLCSLLLTRELLTTHRFHQVANTETLAISGPHIRLITKRTRLVTTLFAGAL
jgi:hypothetical protein